MDSSPDHDQPTGVALATASAQDGSATSGLASGPAKIVLLGLSAGVIFAVVCIAVFPIFRLSLRLAAPFPPPAVAIEREQTIARNNMLNGAIALGMLGALVSGIVATGEAQTRGQLGRRWLAIAAGAVLAAGCGVVGGLAGHQVQTLLAELDAIPPLGRTVLVQMVTLAFLGVGIGGAVGLVAGGWHQAISRLPLGGAAGLLAGLLFPIVCSLVAARIKTEVIVPGGVVGGRSEWIGLAIWTGLFILVLGFVLPMQTRRHR